MLPKFGNRYVIRYFEWPCDVASFKSLGMLLSVAVKFCVTTDAYVGRLSIRLTFVSRFKTMWIFLWQDISEGQGFDTNLRTVDDLKEAVVQVSSISIETVQTILWNVIAQLRRVVSLKAEHFQHFLSCSDRCIAYVHSHTKCNNYEIYGDFILILWLSEIVRWIKNHPVYLLLRGVGL